MVTTPPPRRHPAAMHAARLQEHEMELRRMAQPPLTIRERIRAAFTTHNRKKVTQ